MFFNLTHAKVHMRHNIRQLGHVSYFALYHFTGSYYTCHKFWKRTEYVDAIFSLNLSEFWASTIILNYVLKDLSNDRKWVKTHQK